MTKSNLQEIITSLAKNPNQNDGRYWWNLLNVTGKTEFFKEYHMRFLNGQEYNKYRQLAEQLVGQDWPSEEEFKFLNNLKNIDEVLAVIKNSIRDNTNNLENGKNLVSNWIEKLKFPGTRMEASNIDKSIIEKGQAFLTNPLEVLEQLPNTNAPTELEGSNNQNTLIQEQQQSASTQVVEQARSTELTDTALKEHSIFTRPFVGVYDHIKCLVTGKDTSLTKNTLVECWTILLAVLIIIVIITIVTTYLIRKIKKRNLERRALYNNQETENDNNSLNTNRNYFPYR